MLDFVHNLEQGCRLLAFNSAEDMIVETQGRYSGPEPMYTGPELTSAAYHTAVGPLQISCKETNYKKLIM